jgi:hypothetical protein
LHKRQKKLHLPKNKSNKLFRILICLWWPSTFAWQEPQLWKMPIPTHLLKTSWFLKTGSVGEIQRTPKTEHGVESCLLHSSFFACNLVWVSCGMLKENQGLLACYSFPLDLTSCDTHESSRGTSLMYRCFSKVLFLLLQLASGFISCMTDGHKKQIF